MATSEVTRQESAVPDLVRTPAMEITAEDVALPRLYIGQYMSGAVKDQLVKPGALFTAMSGDDPDPNVLWNFGDKKEKGPVIYVLGLSKGLSHSAPGEELQTWAYGDPTAHEDAWITYYYTIAIPDVDEEVPFKWLLTRTGRPAAKQMNTILKKNEGKGPPWLNAFCITTDKRENNKGEYFVPRVAVVKPNMEHADKAGDLAIMIAGRAPDFGATGEEPAI